MRNRKLVKPTTINNNNNWPDLLFVPHVMEIKTLDQQYNNSKEEISYWSASVQVKVKHSLLSPQIWI